MKRTLALLLLLVCLALSLPISAHADAGGWPTATPTITPTVSPTYTPTYTPLPTDAITPTPTTPPYPAVEGSLITPPVINPSVDSEGNAITDSSLLSAALQPSQTPSPRASITSAIICWPIGIIALLVGIAIVSWLGLGRGKGS